MTPRELKALDQRLTAFLEDLLGPLGRSERGHWARVYVQGLLLEDCVMLTSWDYRVRP